MTLVLKFLITLNSIRRVEHSPMAELNMKETPPNLLPSTPSPCIPLHLSGFLSGDTIQVQGDTQNLHFSVQFNIHQKHAPEDHFQDFSDAHTPENCTSLNSNLSSYMTPITTLEGNDPIANTDPLNHANYTILATTESDRTKENVTVTRLRSGVISPVTYFPPIFRISRGNLRSWGRKMKLRKKKDCGKSDVLERVLRRRSFPVRPCSSYTFFVMDTWGLIKNSSFGETSKRLGEMWCKLPHKDKKVYENMALKDNARYKRQCMLLRSQT